MELLLNLAWLLVTVLCSVTLLRRVRRTKGSAPFWVLVTAVICVMVLLFPVISMTDDLHAEVFTAEDSGKRRVAATQIHQQLAQLDAFIAWLLVLIAVPGCVDRTVASDVPVPRPLAGTRKSTFIRPPPSLLLA